MHSAHSNDSGFVRMQPEGEHSSRYSSADDEARHGTGAKGAARLLPPPLLCGGLRSAPWTGHAIWGGRESGPGTPAPLRSPRGTLLRRPGDWLGGIFLVKAFRTLPSRPGPGRPRCLTPPPAVNPGTQAASELAVKGSGLYDTSSFTAFVLWLSLSFIFHISSCPLKRSV